MMHQNRGNELLAALLTVLLVTMAYAAVVWWQGGLPAASDWFGHSLGAIGLLLMLMTETLYSLRKRSLSARWGRPASWLKFHIFTGIVGPYLAFLHTAWKFEGLAGVVLLLTIIVAMSGFIGRYIYTAVPRTVEGAIIEENELAKQIEALEAELNTWLSGQSQNLWALAKWMGNIQSSANAAGLVWGRGWNDWREAWIWRREKKRFDPALRPALNRLEFYLRRQQQLRRQRASLAAARRLLSLWHTIHVPLGVVLFVLAFVHVGAALYFATLLH
jgi:hypothetical protein